MFKVYTGERGSFNAKCTVKMEDTVDVFEDFFAVGMVDGTVKMAQNADAITLGYAVLIASAQFRDLYATLSDEDKKLVDEELKSAGEVGLYDEQN